MKEGIQAPHPESDARVRWEAYKQELRRQFESHFFFDVQSFMMAFVFVSSPEHADEVSSMLSKTFRTDANRELVICPVATPEEGKDLMLLYQQGGFVGKDVAVSLVSGGDTERQRETIASVSNLNLREVLKRKSSGLVMIVPSSEKQAVMGRFPDLYTQRTISMDEQLPPYV